MNDHIREIEKNWINKKGEFQGGNFNRSKKTLHLKEYLIKNTEFLVKESSYKIRYNFIKNNITSPNVCKKCKKLLLDKDFNVYYCSPLCAGTSEEKSKKISENKRERDKKSPYKEMTLEWWIWKYGEEEGRTKYEERGNKCKNNLENLIKRYGEEEGRTKYEEYVKKIKYTTTEEYNIKKYGEKIGKEKFKERNEKRRMTISNFIRCYGEEEGKKRYEKWYNSLLSVNSYSKISQELFWLIYNKLEIKDKIYFQELNKEFNKYNGVDRVYFYDFVDSKNKKVIEFNGDMWHANPSIFKEQETPIPFLKKTSKEIWNYDKEKQNFIKKFDYQLLIIWESEYHKNKQDTLKKCIDFLKDNSSKLPI